MQKYNVTGMSCAACQARVEKVVSQVEGVSEVSVNLLTNSMNVEGNASETDIIKAVTDAGYGASAVHGGSKQNGGMQEDESLKDTQTPKMVRRLVASIILLIPLMYVSMGHMMWNWPLPEAMAGNHVAMGLYEMLFAIVIMIINQKFFISGFKGLIHKAPNMDTLVAMGSMASFVYSVYSLFAMTGAVQNGNEAAVMTYMNGFYFESAAMILTLITIGKTLESYSKGRTTDALKGLMQLAPQTAVVERNGQEITVPAADVKVGDIFLVRPGESIPVDGLILEGTTAIDESALTGESIPVDKEAGDDVKSATINQSGYIRCRATRVGEDTTIAQIIQMVSDASATKAPIAKVADKVSGIFVPTVLGIAALTFLIWILVGARFGFSLSRAISVLVISCPCALGLATPVAIMVGNGIGAKNGILFKTAVSLEETGKVDIVALDKTGTITMGQPLVTEVKSQSGTEEELVRLAYSLEQKSEHPLARAIVSYAEEHRVTISETEAFTIVPGKGLQAVIADEKVYGGNLQFICNYVPVSPEMEAYAKEKEDQGKTVLYFAKEKRLLGVICVADRIKADSAQAIAQMKQMGIQVVMLTGDNRNTANTIGAEAGVDHVIAGVLPEEKAAVISKLKTYGKVAMVGDGINDAPALTTADMGIAIGAGSDVALDAADVVLVKSSLLDATAAIRLSRRVLRNIHENLFWAFIYNIIGIPLAAGVWYHWFGLTLSPMFGAAAMSLSSFCVVMNALRLNMVRVHDTVRDKPKKHQIASIEDSELFREPEEEEDTNMELILDIKGMMCPHCEAHMKQALEAMDGVETAVTSHTEGTAVVTCTKEISEDAFKKVVADAGYEFVGVR